MAQLLSTLSIISFILAGIFMILAVFFFIYFRIPTVIGDLSGSTARKSIAKMRIANEKTGAKSYRTSKTNASRGKVTETASTFASKTNKEEAIDNMPQTGLLDENKALHVESQQTGLLEGEATGLLVDENETVLLSDNNYLPINQVQGIELKNVESIVLIHTNEVIE